VKCCSSAQVQTSVCRHTLSWKSATWDSSISHFIFMMFCNTLLTFVWSFVAWTSSSLFPDQKTGTISFLSGRHIFKLLWLAWWMCASSAFTALWFKYSEMKPRFCHLLLVWCDLNICCDLSGFTQKSQSQRHYLCLVCTCEHFQTHLVQNLWQLNLSMIVEIHTKVLELWSIIFHDFFFSTLNKINVSLVLSMKCVWSPVSYFWILTTPQI
jgi:hypothetical protein